MQTLVGRKKLHGKLRDHLDTKATADYENLLELIDHMKDPPMRASKAVANSVAVNGVQ